MNEEIIRKIYEGDDSIFDLPYGVFLLNYKKLIGSTKSGSWEA